jgi:lipopolysaccharide export system protein LptA
LPRGGKWWSGLFGLLLAAGTLYAQPAGQVRGEFRAPFIREGRQIGSLSGEAAEFQPDGTLRFRTARVEHFDAQGRTNANVQVLATNCIADLKRGLVWSPEGLSLRTADGQFALAGVGFTWWQTNNELIVSNRVRTAVRKGEVADPNAVTVTIASERFAFNYASNVVRFHGAVLAEDPELQVACERLTVRRSSRGKFDHILAEDSVRMTNPRDGSVMTGDRAEYTLSESGEVMELTGEPRWRDAAREAQAERFVFRRMPKPEPQLLEAWGNAWIRLPLGTNRLVSWPLAAAGTPPPTGGEGPTATTGAETTNAALRSIELSAAVLKLALPPTNGPVQGVVAETNVSLLSPQDGWQATAQQLLFTNGWLELTGSPVWGQGDRQVRGDLLLLDTRDQSFAARGNAQIRFPAALFGSTLPALGATNAPGFHITTNHLVVVESEEAVFRSGVLRFAAPVRARLFEAEVALGELTCRDLAAVYGKRLEGLSAAGDVRMEQYARPGTNRISRLIECGSMRLEFDEAGRLRNLSAAEGVAGQQSEVRAPGGEPRMTWLRTDRVDARFHAHTNRIEWAVAEGGVRVEREERAAEGERAEFTGTNGVLRLTGQPKVTGPDGRILGATALSWDSQTGKVRGEGPFRIEWMRVPTNDLLPRKDLGSPK